MMIKKKEEGTYWPRMLKEAKKVRGDLASGLILVDPRGNQGNDCCSEDSNCTVLLGPFSL